MKNKNEEELVAARKIAFDEALADHNFGAEYVGMTSIEKDGDIWSCGVYLEDEDDEENSVKSNFTVFFEEGSDTVLNSQHQF